MNATDALLRYRRRAAMVRQAEELCHRATTAAMKWRARALYHRAVTLLLEAEQ